MKAGRISSTEAQTPIPCFRTKSTAPASYGWEEEEEAEEEGDPPPSDSMVILLVIFVLTAAAEDVYLLNLSYLLYTYLSIIFIKVLYKKR